jgi:hypothetical protein
VLCRCCCSFAELERARPVPFAGVAVQRSGQEREKRSKGKTEGVCTLAPDFGRLRPLLFAVATAITERQASHYESENSHSWLARCRRNPTVHSNKPVCQPKVAQDWLADFESDHS